VRSAPDPSCVSDCSGPISVEGRASLVMELGPLKGTFDTSKSIQVTDVYNVGGNCGG
jgi:hypothetical protein